jgi:hypothetical protein
MQLPGFTAELSLHQKSASYQAGELNVARVSPRVLAQLRVIGDPVGTCFSWCLLSGASPLQCFFACGPGQLGGGSGVFSTGAFA